MRCKYLLSAFLFLVIVNQTGAQELPFIHYSPSNEVNPLPSASVTNVYQDSRGFIWMSVFSSGLIRFDGVRMIIHNQEDGLRDVGVWQMTEDGNGFLWVSTNSGLSVSEKPLTDYGIGEKVRFTSELDSVVLYDGALSQNKIASDRTGRIWTASSGSGFIRYETSPNGNLRADTLFISPRLTGGARAELHSITAFE